MNEASQKVQKMQSRAQSGKTAKLYDFSHFDNDDAEDHDDDDPGDDDDHYHPHHHCRCQSATAAPLQPLSHFVHRWIALTHPHALEPFYDSTLRPCVCLDDEDDDLVASTSAFYN